ncbi:hypothetical protein PC123_g20587 [Phytophthora cactorum]|nr:hypothetical protein PC120_g20062 [Phytophthora cactorum]KAG4043954.1 hypothetical protein PC123_g20587 [Phytophthora cactorum]
MAKVTAYQRKRPGVCDLDIAVEIVGLGVFANSPVTLMKKWHQAHEVLLQVQKTLAWIKQLYFSRHGNAGFAIEEDKNLPEVLRNIPILSTKALVLELAAKECLSED